jgi:hypothetical protein
LLGRRRWDGVASLGVEFKNAVLDADAADWADAGATAELKNCRTAELQNCRTAELETANREMGNLHCKRFLG